MSESSADQRVLDRRARLAQFTEELGTLLKSGAEPLDALRASAAKHLEPEGPADALARGTFALASDFETENPGASILRDPMALVRVLEAYIKATIELASLTNTELNLPFLTATAKGPLHLSIKLNRAGLQALATREPPPKIAAAPSSGLTSDSYSKLYTDSNSPPKKKSWWWPF